MVTMRALRCWFNKFFALAHVTVLSISRLFLPNEQLISSHAHFSLDTTIHLQFSATKLGTVFGTVYRRKRSQFASGLQLNH